jgi:hypothetical protein
MISRFRGSRRRAVVRVVEDGLTLNIDQLIRARGLIPGSRISGRIDWTFRGQPAGAVRYESQLALPNAYVEANRFDGTKAGITVGQEQRPRPPTFDRDIAPLDPTEFAQPLHESSDPLALGRRRGRSPAHAARSAKSSCKLSSLTRISAPRCSSDLHRCFLSTRQAARTVGRGLRACLVAIRPAPLFSVHPTSLTHSAGLNLPDALSLASRTSRRHRSLQRTSSSMVWC